MGVSMNTNMKLSDALSIYQTNRKELTETTRNYVKLRDTAQKKFETTGDIRFSEEAATLQLSIDRTQELFDKNQEVLGRLNEQYYSVWNAEVAKQQADAEEEMAAELSKIMTVARRMSHGDRVPATDERKLMEFDKDLYMAAKNAQMMAKLKERKEYDSLWDDEEEKKEYDPQGEADNAIAQGELPEIDVESVGEPVQDSE